MGGKLDTRKSLPLNLVHRKCSINMIIIYALQGSEEACRNPQQLGMLTALVRFHPKAPLGHPPSNTNNSWKRQYVLWPVLPSCFCGWHSLEKISSLPFVETMPSKLNADTESAGKGLSKAVLCTVSLKVFTRREWNGKVGPKEMGRRRVQRWNGE